MHASQQQLHLNIFEGNTFYNAIAPSLNSMYKVSYTMLKEGIADLLIGVIEKSYWFWRIALQDQKFPIFWKVPIFFSLWRLLMCANSFHCFLSVCLSFWQAILQQPDTCATNGKPINVPGILKWPPLHTIRRCVQYSSVCINPGIKRFPKI